MRLHSLEAEGFRGLPNECRFDLDADAVVVIGANGHGKTSLFDAILWALSGRVPRLGEDESNLVSMYSPSGAARASLILLDSNSEHFKITRSFDGDPRPLSVEHLGKSMKGPSAEGYLLEHVWPDASTAVRPFDAMASAITRSVYLQQDLIREFVEATDDQDRFRAVSELVGAGRVGDLQVALEREKKAWSTTTNSKAEEARLLRERLTSNEARLAELSQRLAAPSLSLTEDAWKSWWQEVAEVGVNTPYVDLGARDASQAIEAAIKQLETMRLASDRRVQLLKSSQTELAALSRQTLPPLEPLQSNALTLSEQVQILRRQVEAEQQRGADWRQAQAALRERSEQLRALAVLALGHLGDHCPVCAQQYDIQETRRRLETIAKGESGDSAANEAPDLLPQYLSALASKERALATAEASLREAEQTHARHRIAAESIYKQLASLGADANGASLTEDWLTRLIQLAERLQWQQKELHRRAEAFSLKLTQSTSEAAATELRREIEKQREALVAQEADCSARQATGLLAQKVIDALRDAMSLVVEERLKDIGLILQAIYSRIDPHPSFRAVTFLSRFSRGRGQLSTVIRDSVIDKETPRPSVILSSSQLNALAVSVFLALNLGVARPPLRCAILDDPLQSLDDINLLGVVDLLRRTKDNRQLIVSTHDARFGSLLARKLRPMTPQGRTRVIELYGWTRSGPRIEARDVAADVVSLRLAGATATG